jgi:hypothetical protein
MAKDIIYYDTLVIKFYKGNQHTFYATKPLNKTLLEDLSPRKAQRISISKSNCEIEFGNILMLRYISIEELIEQLPELKVELLKKAVEIKNYNLDEFTSYKNHFKYTHIEGDTTYWWSDNLNYILNIGNKKLFVFGVENEIRTIIGSDFFDISSSSTYNFDAFERKVKIANFLN